MEVSEDLRIKTGNVSDTEIKDWCIKTIEQQDKDSLLKKAERWCIIYSTFEDKLKSEGLSIGTEINSFKTKYSSLGNLKEVVDKVTLESSESGSGDDANGKKLQKWCGSNAYLSREDKVSYENFKNHCKK
ncbi:hypothetical protein MHF_0660 [Mycoplasma haemofelis Ohio2]|uniref:Uncharacterized protein n=1 Tax=Mycoplasma haemofelis (strain Ohio2) TaxID=859194 RepID=F6FI84_MYCHI|nr:hypothetical protein MHF_0660 [Mycoplasma haemofelis Ohio2]